MVYVFNFKLTLLSFYPIPPDISEILAQTFVVLLAEYLFADPFVHRVD